MRTGNFFRWCASVICLQETRIAIRTALKGGPASGDSVVRAAMDSSELLLETLHGCRSWGELFEVCHVKTEACGSTRLGAFLHNFTKFYSFWGTKGMLYFLGGYVGSLERNEWLPASSKSFDLLLSHFLFTYPWPLHPHHCPESPL